MKRLCIILFILSPCFGQFSEKSFKLVRGEDFFTIRPDKIIKINDKEFIYKKIDYKNKQIMVEIYNSEKEKSENIKFNFNEIKSISFTQNKFYRALQSSVGGAFLGIFIAFYLNEKNSEEKEGFSFDNVFDEIGKDMNVFGGLIFGGLAGIIIALYTNSDYDLDIGDNNWKIVK